EFGGIALFKRATTGGGRDDNCPLHSFSCHQCCREPLFRLAQQGLSQISGRRILRVVGHPVLSISCRCFGASVGDRFCRDTSDQRWPLHRSFRPLLALFLFWLRQEAKCSKTNGDEHEWVKRGFDDDENLIVVTVRINSLVPARCGRPTSPPPAALAGTLRGETVLPDRPRRDSSARRSAASALTAARSPRAAMLRPRRRAT